MSFTPRTRPKSESQNSKPKPPKSSSSISSHSLLIEPSPSFFPSKGELSRLFAVVAIAASVAITCNVFVNFLNRQPKPFCDNDAGFDNSLSDLCEPCPRNGVCHEGKLECARGYRKLGKLCVEDADINETAKKLSKLEVKKVCEAYAQYLCGGTGTVWVQEDEMWNDLDDSKLMENYGLDSAIYVHAKQRAMESVDKLLETRKNINGSKEFKCPESLVEHYKPVTCYIRQWIAEHALILVPFTALLLGCTLLLLRIRRRHYLSVRAEQLYNQVCDILEEKALTSKGVNVEQEAWVVASWLRDHLLSPRERKHPLLWKMVEDLVQQDSRLDRFPKMVKGESKVVWEWQVEGSLSSSGKRKKHEESKLKSSEGTNVSSNQQRRPLQYGFLQN
ncbi:unnamed protein product [Ilex paraguariensis]|uniref:Man1/Src1-like C-terminal domain-containing protein n=1 Tax=Ilex paraguariensis TaxID=185542 RepID=A0ABC8TT63_9AQUA